MEPPRSGAPAAAGAPSLIRKLVPWIAVALLAFLSHATYLDNGFVWLDHGDIEQGSAVRSAGEWGRVLFEPYGSTAFYRPLVTLMHGIDAAVWGVWAPGFHLTNVLLHTLVSLAALLFLRAFCGFHESEAAFGAALVAVHPLSWLPAGAISYRPELLVTLFVFLTLAAYARARETGGAVAAALALLSFFLALLSKETAAAWVPALVVLWELRARRAQPSPARPRVRAMRASSALFAGMLAVLALYVALRVNAVPRVWGSSYAELTPSDAIGTRLAVLGERMLELVVPLRPGLSDAAPVVSLFSAPALLSLLAISVAFALALRDGLRSHLGFALVFLMVALAPAANVVPLPRFTSPHYGYFASVGTAMLVLIAWRAARPSRVTAGVFAVVAGLWSLSMLVATVSGGARFHDDLSLFEPEVARDPSFREGRFYLARGYRDSGELERAADEYEAALPEPERVLAFVDVEALLMNYGSLRFEQQRFDEAEVLLARAAEETEVEHRRTKIATARAVIARSRLDFAKVEELLREPGLVLDTADALLMLADAQSRLGHVEESIGTLERAIPLLEGERRTQMETILAAQKELFEARSR